LADYIGLKIWDIFLSFILIFYILEIGEF